MFLKNHNLRLVFSPLWLSALWVASASGQAAPDTASRQVTLFGIIASPTDLSVDPKLRPIEDQLRRLLPGHGFTLLGTETRRIALQNSLNCVLGESGFTARAQLVEWSDMEGKVALRFALDYRDGYQETTELATIVRTPPNQLFFCDKALPNRMRLLIGIGAR